MVGDLASIQSISKLNKGFRFLLRVIDSFSKYASVALLKDKIRVTIVNAFQVILKKFNKKTNKIWKDKGSEFYKSSSKKPLQEKYIEKYSAHNEGKSVLAERFIKTFQKNIYKYMTSVLKLCTLIN